MDKIPLYSFKNRLVSPTFAKICLNSFSFAVFKFFIHLLSFAQFHLVSLSFAQFHLVSLSFAQFRLDSCRIAQFSLGFSILLPWLVLTKNFILFYKSHIPYRLLCLSQYCNMFLTLYIYIFLAILCKSCRNIFGGFLKRKFSCNRLNYSVQFSLDITLVLQIHPGTAKNYFSFLNLCKTIHNKKGKINQLIIMETVMVSSFQR